MSNPGLLMLAVQFEDAPAERIADVCWALELTVQAVDPAATVHLDTARTDPEVLKALTPLQTSPR